MTTFFKLCFICLLYLWLGAGCKRHNDFSQSVKDFEQRNEAKRGTALFLYPGTIKMFNANRDSLFDDFVKDIQKVKLTIFPGDKGLIDTDNLNNLVNNIRKESFTELIQMKRDGGLFDIFVRKEGSKPEEFLAIVRMDSTLFIADLMGSIPVNQLPALMSGKINMSGFSSFLSNSMKKKSNKKNEKRPSDK